MFIRRDMRDKGKRREIGTAARSDHVRGTLVVFAVAILLLSGLFCAGSVVIWRDQAIQDKVIVAAQADYEDEALCIKFGFSRGTIQHKACKLDLLDLRHSDEDLMAQTGNQR